jgi:hypothetical protein
MSLLFGVACPLEEAGSGSVFVNEQDVDKLDLKGKKLKLEHQQAHYGEVVDCWADTCPKDKKRKLYVLARTDDSFAGRRCDKLLAEGQLKELSLGHRADVDMKTLTAINKRAMELSIVQKGAKEGCHIMHVTPVGGKHAKHSNVNIKSLALHKCSGVSAVVRASALMSETLTTNNNETAAATQDNNLSQMDVLSRRLAEKEESERIGRDEKQALIDELAKMKNENKRFRDHEEQRMTDMKNDWIGVLKDMFNKNGDKVPDQFENSIHSLSETQHKPFVEVMCSVAKYQKSTGKELEDLRSQLETERTHKKQISDQNVQKDGTIQALRTVQNTQTKTVVTDAVKGNNGMFASHTQRFHPTAAAHLPKMGEYGRILPQPVGAGMKERFPDLFQSIIKSAENQKGMDTVSVPTNMVR